MYLVRKGPAALPVHRQDILCKRERVGKLIWEKNKAKVGVAREKKRVREICKDTCACLFTVWGTGPKQVSLEVMMLTLTLVDSLSLKLPEIKQCTVKDGIMNPGNLNTVTKHLVSASGF